MNEELQKALSELLNKANGGIDAAGDFLSSELPDVISQLLMWHGVYSAAMCLFGVVFCAAWIYANKKQFDYFKDKDLVDHPELIFNLIQAFFIIVPLTTLNLTWLQIWIAPKIFLIEYAAKLGG